MCVGLERVALTAVEEICRCFGSGFEYLQIRDLDLQFHSLGTFVRTTHSLGTDHVNMGTYIV